MHAQIIPTIAETTELIALMQSKGMAVLSAERVRQVLGLETAHLNLHELDASWDDLARDAYLKDGGRYRLRRHACFTVRQGALTPIAARAHFQPVEYNALHGGMRRWFEPMHEQVSSSAVWQQLVTGAAGLCSQVHPAQTAQADTWFIEAHQFRIDTTDGIGRPTPEGAHRDGVDFVMVFLLKRVGIKGGETRVFEADGPNGQRFTLSEPWSLLWMDDARVIHESTPIQPEGEYGYRDTLVLTFRRGGFLGD